MGCACTSNILQSHSDSFISFRTPQQDFPDTSELGLAILRSSSLPGQQIPVTETKQKTKTKKNERRDLHVLDFKLFLARRMRCRSHRQPGDK